MSRTRYTEEFKAQAVEISGLGKPVSQVADELGISADLIYRWRREAQDASRPRRSLAVSTEKNRIAVDLEAELKALRKANSRLQLEVDVLKKAAVILGTSPRAKNGK